MTAQWKNGLADPYPLVWQCYQVFTKAAQKFIEQIKIIIGQE